MEGGKGCGGDAWRGRRSSGRRLDSLDERVAKADQLRKLPAPRSRVDDEGHQLVDVRVESERLAISSRGRRDSSSGGGHVDLLRECRARSCPPLRLCLHGRLALPILGPGIAILRSHCDDGQEPGRAPIQQAAEANTGREWAMRLVDCLRLARAATGARPERSAGRDGAQVVFCGVSAFRHQDCRPASGVIACKRRVSGSTMGRCSLVRRARVKRHVYESQRTPQAVHAHASGTESLRRGLQTGHGCP